jgi:hypothetical protein
LEYQVPLSRPAALAWQAPAQQQVEDFLADYGLREALQKQLAACYWWQE